MIERDKSGCQIEPEIASGWLRTILPLHSRTDVRGAGPGQYISLHRGDVERGAEPYALVDGVSDLPISKGEEDIRKTNAVYRQH